MWGMTPPPTMVPLIKVSSSSSPLIASCKCLGVIRLTLISLLAFPASSKTSAVRYSRIAAEYTAAVAPTLPFADTLDFNRRWIGPTGNCNKNKQSSQHITGILWSSFLQEYLNCYKASMKMVLPVKSIPRITSVESRFWHENL